MKPQTVLALVVVGVAVVILSGYLTGKAALEAAKKYSNNNPDVPTNQGIDGD